jgi:catechol 2,3-dioxygenase-like lactoylglutathione lyase family enzyme
MLMTCHSPTPDLDSSVRFYTVLGFRQLSGDPVLFTDGKVLIEINPDRFARAGLKFYGKTWAHERGLLEMLGPVLPTPGGLMLTDPSGVSIYLSEQEAPVAFKPAESSSGLTGSFTSVSLETGDLPRSAAIYEALGFKQIAGAPESGFVVLSRDGYAISLMRMLSCPHLFFNPSLSYFNGGNNLDIIAGIRKAGIPIAEEISHFNKEGIVDNIIIRDPGGYGFFIFND